MDLEKLSPAKLEAAYDKALDSRGIAGFELIRAGRGFETGSETRSKAAEGDALAMEWVETQDKLTPIIDEMERRKRYHGSLKRTPKPKF